LGYSYQKGTNLKEERGMKMERPADDMAAEKALMEDIKNRQFKRAYLLTGEEAYLRNQYKKKLQYAILSPEDTMNFAYFEGKNTNPGKIIDLAETMPFFAENRVILIENSGFMKDGCSQLADYIAEIPQTTCLIFVETEVDKRGKLYKAVKNKGMVVDFIRKKEQTLIHWILGMLKREGKKITKETMYLFLERTGNDMENISCELEKLFCFTMGREVITTADVETICTRKIEDRIFDMIRAITQKNQQKALELYTDLLSLKESPSRIVYLITQKFNQLFQLKELRGQGIAREEMAEKLHIPSFALNKYMVQCGKYTKEELLRIVENCVDMEEKIKTGLVNPQIGVELLIVKCST